MKIKLSKMNNEKSEFKCRLKKKCINIRSALIGNLFVSFIVFQILLNTVSYAQHGRVAPGVNPNKYQQEVPVAQQGKIMNGLSDLGINILPRRDNAFNDHIMIFQKM